MMKDSLHQRDARFSSESLFSRVETETEFVPTAQSQWFGAAQKHQKLYQNNEMEKEIKFTWRVGK